MWKVITYQIYFFINTLITKISFYSIFEAFRSYGYDCLLKNLMLMLNIQTQTCTINETVTERKSYVKISVCRRAEEGSVGDSWRAKITARNCSCRSLFRRFLRRGNYSHATRGNQRRQSRTGRELHWVHGRPGPGWPQIWSYFPFLAWNNVLSQPPSPLSTLIQIINISFFIVIAR